MKKRAFFLVTMLIVLLTALTVTASAATDSGTCGEDLTWTLDSDGTLTISGEGAMSDFGYHGSPWYNKGTIQTIVIENGVTTIGRYAFQDCDRLPRVTIPNSVTTIGAAAFSGCARLTSVTIPDGVTTVGANAFYGCAGLISVTVPDSVTSIGGNTFCGCYDLTSVTFEGDAPTFGTMVFDDVTATVYYPAGNTTWTDENMLQYGGTLTWEKVYVASGTCGDTADDNVNWTLTEDGTLTISGEGAMSDYPYGNRVPWRNSRGSITSVVVEPGVTAIGEYAFRDCTGRTV